MSKTITTDIEEAIKSHLPEQVNTLLRKELARIPDLEKQVEQLKRIAEDEKGFRRKVEKDLAELQAMGTQWGNADHYMQEALHERSLAQTETRILAIKEQHASEKVALMQSLIGQVFGNRIVRELVQRKSHEDIKTTMEG